MLFPFGLPPDPGIELVVASHGVMQGISQSDGAQINPRVYVRIGEAQIGGQWRNISHPSAKGVAALFLRFSRKFSKTQLEAGAAYRMRTGTTGPLDTRAWELSGGLRRNFGRLSLRASAEYSPKDFESGKSLYIQLEPAFDIDSATKFSASIGRRERERNPDYTSFNAGISRVVRQRLTLDTRYYRTNRSELGARFQERLVVSGRLAL